MDFAQFCFVANRLAAHTKQAAPEPGGLSNIVNGLPPAAIGAILGGGAGLVTGAFSDKPGSMLRHGLIGAGLGAGVGYGGDKLLTFLKALQMQRETGQAAADGKQLPAPSSNRLAAPLTPQEILAPQPQAEGKIDWNGEGGNLGTWDTNSGELGDMSPRPVPPGLAAPASWDSPAAPAELTGKSPLDQFSTL